MADCFDTIIGLSDRDCDCFSAGRPDGSGAVVSQRQAWEFEKFDAGDSPASPLILTTEYNLPTDDPEAKIQLFAGSSLIQGTDYTITGAKEITILTPVPGQVYQIWYLANIQSSQAVAEYSVSDSGLYITDLLPEDEIAALTSCDGTIWDELVKARSIAIKEFQATLNATMSRRYQLTRQTFEGFIGEAKGAQYMATTPVYAGLRIRTNPLRSGYLKIKRIMSLFEATGTISATIYNGAGEAVSPSFNIATQAGARAITEVNIELPLVQDFEEEQDYFLVYAFNASNKPKLNLLSCGCNGSISQIRNVENYPVATNYTGRHGWHNFILVGGWEQDDLDFENADDEVSIYMNGLSLEIEVGCDMAKGLCTMLSGFGSNPYAMSAATAIQRRAAAWLINRRRRSSYPNRNDLIMTDELKDDLRTWEGEFAEIMQFLSTNIPATSNDCLECKPRTKLASILG